jgi:hypothetical protein
MKQICPVMRPTAKASTSANDIRFYPFHCPNRVRAGDKTARWRERQPPIYCPFDNICISGGLNSSLNAHFHARRKSTHPEPRCHSPWIARLRPSKTL